MSLNFREAARRTALSVDDDMDVGSTMDLGTQPHGWDGARPPGTDDLDPAAPGGPSPYNGADPFSEPVVDDPEWLDPQDPQSAKGKPMPYRPGPGVDTTTLHNARLASYERRIRRFR